MGKSVLVWIRYPMEWVCSLDCPNDDMAYQMVMVVMDGGMQLEFQRSGFYPQ